MPIFEFRCSACGHLEEVLQKHTDPAPDACPKCNAQKTMGKELSLSAFHLKGGGWYKDLYSSSSTPAAASGASTGSSSTGDAKPASESKPSTETKTETKTEAKPAAAPSTSGSSGSSGSSSSGPAAA